jgi:biofilm PGA synthesis N-glycosyltransferase PgaC
MITTSFLILSSFILTFYVSFMFWLILGSKSKGQNSSSQIKSPDVTIIIPLHNEVQRIHRLEVELDRQDYKGNWRVIMVEDHSDDGTWARLRQVKSQKIQVLKSRGRGKKRAIETGLLAAESDWVLTLDADCSISPGWLSAWAEYFSMDKKMILGSVFSRPEGTFLAALQYFESAALWTTTAGSANLRYPLSSSGANLAYQKEAYFNLKPYESNWQLNTGDDMFFMLSIRSGYPQSIGIATDPDTIVITEPGKSFSDYLSARSRWAGKGKYYSDFITILLGLTILSASVLFYAWVILLLMNIQRPAMFTFLVVKWLVDIVMIARGDRLNKLKSQWIYLFPSLFIYPFIVSYSVINGFIRTPGLEQSKNGQEHDSTRHHNR